MPGVNVEVVCAQCGKPTKTRTGTIAYLRTMGKLLLCASCRDTRNTEYQRLYINAQNAANRAWRP